MPAKKKILPDLSAEEKILWQRLRAAKLGEFNFLRQYIVEEHEFAFYCADAKLAIEIDTPTSRRDYKRDAYLATLGVSVVYFHDVDIGDNLDNVLEQIMDLCRTRTASAPMHAPVRFVATPSPRSLRPQSSPALILIAALIAGLMLVNLFFVVSGFNRTASSTAFSNPLATLTRGATPSPRTPTPLPTETPFSFIDARPARTPNLLFAQAEKNLESQPQAVVDLLLPQLAQLTVKSDLQDAYSYLGRAEMKLQHYGAAVTNFKKLNELEPAVEYLYMLAVANDLAGNRGDALENYRALAAWKSDDALVYRAAADKRIQELSAAPGTPTP